MKKLLFFFLIMQAATSFGQRTVTGLITDSLKNPIKGVSVSIKNTDIKTYTDEDGKYSINVPSGHKTLVFKLSEMKVREMDVNGDVVNLTMTSVSDADLAMLSLQELMNISVSVATKTKSTLDDSPGIVSVISRDVIEKSCAQTLADIIRMVPGLDFSKGSLGWGENTDNFYGRGVLNTFSQTVLILLNGKNRFNDFTYACPFMSTRINLDMIEYVEIIRGPGSALYGGNAFAAVINIVTRDKGLPGETVFEVSGSETPQGSAYMLTKHKLFKTDWSVGAQGKYFFDKGRTYSTVSMDKLYTNAKLPDSDKITDGINPSYDFSMNISAPDNKFNAQIWRTDHSVHPFLTGFFPQPNSYKYKTTQTLLNIDFQPVKNLSISTYHSIMTWDSRLSLYWEPPTTVGTRYSAMDLYGTSQKNNSSSIDVSYVFDIKKHNIMIGTNYLHEAQVDPTVTYDSRIAELYGYTLTDQTVREIVFTEKDTGWVSYLPQVRNQFTIYSQDNWKISDALEATIGIRYDYFDDLKESNIINPRIALVWSAFDKSKIKFLYGQAFRPPSPSETSIILSPIWGNPDLKAEKIKTGEIAFIHYFPFGRFQINGFYCMVQAPINYVTDGVTVSGQTWDTYKNLGGAKMYGSEIELQAKYWWINYSFVNSQIDKGDGKYQTTPFMASHHVNAGMHYTFFNNLTINNQLYFKSKRPAFSETESDSKPYFVDDISISYNHNFVNFGLGCRNVFNNIWELPLMNGGTYKYPYRGRELFARLTVKIKHNSTK